MSDSTVLKKNESVEAEKGQVHELTAMDVQFVSLVNRGANRQNKFLMVKTGNLLNKVVPETEASSDDKIKARDERSARYGIEVLATGSALTYPAGFPTTETMYGDPVNLKYPWGNADNGLDIGRLRNALARFKQNYSAYGQEKSRSVVYERIVRRALAEGVDVSYDPNNPVDTLLPQDLKDKLQSKTSKDGAGAADAQPKTKPDVDSMAWLEEASERITSLLLDAAIIEQARLGLKPEPAVDAKKDEEEVVPPEPVTEPPEVQKTDDSSIVQSLRQEIEAQRRALEETKEALRKSEIQITKVKRGTVGGSSGLTTGLKSSTQPTTIKPAQQRWVSGGDMAAMAKGKGQR